MSPSWNRGVTVSQGIWQCSDPEVGQCVSLRLQGESGQAEQEKRGGGGACFGLIFVQVITARAVGWQESSKTSKH